MAAPLENHRATPPQSSSSPNLAECIEHADEDIFQNFRTLLRIGCTLVVRQSVHSPVCDGPKPTCATGWGKISASLAHPDEHEPQHGEKNGLSNVHRKEQTENVLKLHTV